jgi:hypothetical protein
MELALGNGARPSKYKVSITTPPEIMVSGSDKALNTLICETKIPEMKMSTLDMGFDGRTIQIPHSIDIKNTWTATFYVDDVYFARRFFEYWMLYIDSYSSATEEAPASPLGDAALGGLGGLIGGLFGGNSNNVGGFVKADYDPVSSMTSDEYPTPIQIKTSGKYNLIEKKVTPTLKDYTGTIDITQVGYTGADICTYTLFNAYPTNIGSIGFKDSDTHGISTIEVTFSFTDMRYQKAGGLLENLVSAADKISKGNFF